MLLPGEYNEAYFTGAHPGGYTSYGRFNRVDLSLFTEMESTGEYFSDIGKKMRLLAFLDGKKVLELGCGYGYTIQWLRNQGVDAWGCEVSAFAVSQADPSIRPYIFNQDALTFLSACGKNAYNVIYSKDFLCCFSDADLSGLVTQMNRVGFLQAHQLRQDYNAAYYNNKTLAGWIALPFKKGTVFIWNNDFTTYTTK